MAGIDTVVNAICDMQGRLLGKRVTGDFFVEHCIDHGTHFCVYLLGTEMEMQTPEGYALMNWEMGYGDWQARPDWSTLRIIPWLEKTALVLADAADEATGDLIAVAPRTILRRQIARAAEHGLHLKMASELEFYLLDETFEGAQAKGFQGLQRFGWYNEDYHLLQGTKAEPFYRQLRNQTLGGGYPDRVHEGRSGGGPARDQLPLCRCARCGRPPRAAEARGEGDGLAEWSRDHLHGEARPHLDRL